MYVHSPSNMQTSTKWTGKTIHSQDKHTYHVNVEISSNSCARNKGKKQKTSRNAKEQTNKKIMMTLTRRQRESYLNRLLRWENLIQSLHVGRPLLYRRGWNALGRRETSSCWPLLKDRPYWSLHPCHWRSRGGSNVLGGRETSSCWWPLLKGRHRRHLRPCGWTRHLPSSWCSWSS